MMKRFDSTISLFLVFVFILSLLGCGGGSAGTGTGDSSLRIQGVVRNNSGAPIEAATVTVIETGEADQTDSNGAFELNPQISAASVTLEIRKNNRSALTTVTAPSENGTISIEVKFDDVREIVEKSELSVESKIVGACDIYFENFSTIRQANVTPDGLSCVLKVTVKAGEILVPHVPIAIQYRACDGKGAWITSALGATMSGANIGTAQIEFPYIDDRKHCLYRIVTPFGENTVRPVITMIETFTYQ